MGSKPAGPEFAGKNVLAAGAVPPLNIGRDPVPFLMADLTLRLAENVPGPWYVDDTCTPCHVCLEEAGPDTPNPLMRYNEDESKVCFFKQPATPEELGAAQRALEICPTEAVGKDG